MAFELHVPEIAGVIQLAVAPVFLLTAIGTVIAALNIRLGRAVDRRRELEVKVAALPAEELRSALDELGVLARRIHSVYLAVLAAVTSGLFVCLLMLALIASLLLFLREIFLAVSTPRHVSR